MTGRKFSDWAREQEARETPAQAELRRRFGEEFRRKLGAEPPRRAGFLHRALLHGLLRHPFYVLTGLGREPALAEHEEDVP